MILKPLKYFLVLITVAANILCQAQAQDYSVTDLGTFGGTTNYVTGINNAGQVVGYSSTWTSLGTVSNAYLYSNGSMTALGTLGGTNSMAEGINDAGQVVGSSYTTGNTNSHAFLYSSGNMTDLGTLGGGNSNAAAINNTGQIVGDSYSSIRDSYGTPVDHAFVYSNGVMTDLGTLGGGSSFASAINGAGQVVGASYTTSNFGVQAFEYSNGTMSPLGPLGALSASGSVPHAINNSGQIVGGHGHAFLYSNGIMNDLGTLGGGLSTAYGINSNGLIVGQANGAGPGLGIPYAFLYSNGTMTNLAGIKLADGGYLNNATGINDAGQIVAMDSLGHGYILTPVPEPGEWLLMLMGLGMIGFISTCRKNQGASLSLA
jgi:probable HAF family extracellular repeat protein